MRSRCFLWRRGAVLGLLALLRPLTLGLALAVAGVWPAATAASAQAVGPRDRGTAFRLLFAPGAAGGRLDGPHGARNARALDSIAHALRRASPGVRALFVADRRRWCRGGAQARCRADALLMRRFAAAIAALSTHAPDVIARLRGGLPGQAFVEEIIGANSLPPPPVGTEALDFRLARAGPPRTGSARCPAMLAYDDPQLPPLVGRSAGGPFVPAPAGGALGLGPGTRLRLVVPARGAAAGELAAWWERGGRREPCAAAFLAGKTIPAPPLPATLIVAFRGTSRGAIASTKGFHDNVQPLPSGGVRARVSPRCHWRLLPLTP